MGTASKDLFLKHKKLKKQGIFENYFVQNRFFGTSLRE
jgi:hypothetical protein